MRPVGRRTSGSRSDRKEFRCRRRHRRAAGPPVSPSRVRWSPFRSPPSRPPPPPRRPISPFRSCRPLRTRRSRPGISTTGGITVGITITTTTSGSCPVCRCPAPDPRADGFFAPNMTKAARPIVPGRAAFDCVCWIRPVRRSSCASRRWPSDRHPPSSCRTACAPATCRSAPDPWRAARSPNPTAATAGSGCRRARTGHP